MSELTDEFQQVVTGVTAWLKEEMEKGRTIEFDGQGRMMLVNSGGNVKEDILEDIKRKKLTSGTAEERQEADTQIQAEIAAALELEVPA